MPLLLAPTSFHIGVSYTESQGLGVSLNLGQSSSSHNRSLPPVMASSFWAGFAWDQVSLLVGHGLVSLSPC